MSDIILKADRVLVGEDLNLKEHMAVIVRDGKIEENRTAGGVSCGRRCGGESI